jgi:hypothetical protein
MHGRWLGERADGLLTLGAASVGPRDRLGDVADRSYFTGVPLIEEMGQSNWVISIKFADGYSSQGARSNAPR